MKNNMRDLILKRIETIRKIGQWIMVLLKY